MSATIPATLAPRIDEARLLARQGRFAEALKAFEALVREHPEIALAEFGRANALLAMGRAEEAVAGYDRALSLDDGLADAWNNRGCALQALARHVDAIESFARAIALAPGDVDVRYNRANSLRAIGRQEEALATYDEVLALAPGHVDAKSNKAALLATAGRHAEALEILDDLVRLLPDRAPLRANRGGVLVALGRHAAALADFEAALARAPQSAEALSGLGRALLGLGRAADAVAAFDRLLAANHANARAWANRGLALAALGEHADALASYDRASALEPSLAQIHINKGAALYETKALAAALASYDQALALEPDAFDALVGRANVLRELGRHAEAAAVLDKALESRLDDESALGGRLNVALDTCDWETTARLADVVKQRRVPIPPITAVRLGLAPDLLMDIAKAEAARLARSAPSIAVGRRGPLRRAGRRIRLGYLSSDFGHHAVGYQIGELIERHDRARFEVIGFSSAASDGSPLQRRILGAFDAVEHVRDLGNPVLDRLIRARDIDILVDLNGHTTGSRLAALARRPAPIQVTYMGYPGTLGADFIDYAIADRTVLPEHDRRFFTEQPVWMSDCYQVSDSTQRSAVVPRRADERLPERGFVFASFNAAHKITPPIWAVWMRLLRRVQGSVLWLVAANEIGRANLLRAAAGHGIDESRLVFSRHVSPEAHLARQQLADLFLDTLPYCAHGTASLSLRVGLPILTCRGETFAGRVGASLLGCLGMHDLIAETIEAYEARALALASEPGAIADVKARLAVAVRSSSLFDTTRFARNLERGFEQMVEIHDRGEAARPIDAC